MSGQRIGFIGLGNMGGRIAKRLVDAGHAVSGYDPVAGRAQDAGAVAAESVAALAADVDVVLLSLPDSDVIEKVARGPDGLLAHVRTGQVVVDLSTSAPSRTALLHADFAAEGVELVDAGISGGAAAAEKGTLTIMAGGSEAVVDGLAWLFDPFAAAVFHMGGPGAGHTAKLLNNFLNAVTLAATAETMVAARKAGLDLEVFLEVLNRSSGASFATHNRFPAIVRGDYLEGGLSNRLMTKDIVLYLDHVRELGVPSLNGAGPLASFGLATQLGYGDQISNRVVDAIGDIAGGVRLFNPSDHEDSTT